ncbi:MAG: hypothetical protein WBF58_01810 [Xanthobacteraceae bacterium]
MPEQAPKPLSSTELEFDVKQAKLAQVRLFYAGVGQGISHWARMEERLVQIAARLLRSSERKAGLVLYSIINFYVWIDIIDQLFVLDGTYKNAHAKWQTLVSMLKKENDIRVRLAHHALDLDIEVDHEKHSMQAYLRPGKFDTRTKAKTLKPIETQEIIEFTGRVSDLHDQLILVLEQMKKSKQLR